MDGSGLTLFRKQYMGLAIVLSRFTLPPDPDMKQGNNADSFDERHDQ